MVSLKDSPNQTSEIARADNQYHQRCLRPFKYGRRISGVFTPSSTLRVAATFARRLVAVPGLLKKIFIEIPSTFKAPPKPVDYKPPRPSGNSLSSSGHPTAAPAGHPAMQTATVAAVGECLVPQD